MQTIIIRGPLGVGKSTVAKALAEELYGNYISVDDVLDEHHLADGDGIPVENFIIANNFIAEKIKESNSPTIIDGNFYYQEQIDDLIKKLPEAPSIFTITAPIETCLERDASRTKSYGENAARFVYDMVASVKIGTEIQSENTTKDQVVETILKYRK